MHWCTAEHKGVAAAAGAMATRQQRNNSSTIMAAERIRRHWWQRGSRGIASAAVGAVPHSRTHARVQEHTHARTYARPYVRTHKLKRDSGGGKDTRPNNMVEVGGIVWPSPCTAKANSSPGSSELQSKRRIRRQAANAIPVGISYTVVHPSPHHRPTKSPHPACPHCTSTSILGWHLPPSTCHPQPSV